MIKPDDMCCEIFSRSGLAFAFIVFMYDAITYMELKNIEADVFLDSLPLEFKAYFIGYAMFIVFGFALMYLVWGLFGFILDCIMKVITIIFYRKPVRFYSGEEV